MSDHSALPCCDACARAFRAGDVMGDAAAQHLRGVHDSIVVRNADPVVAPARPGDAAYGHVVVDEAQDLSAMQWRAVARRCPSLSMTIAGDQGQAIRAGRTGSWDTVADALGALSYELVELTVNYRAPAEVMDAAVAELVAAGIETSATRSVRSTRPPIIDVLDDIAPADVRGALDALRVDGTVAVIAPAAMCPSLRDEGVEALDVLEAKGLEFDAVVLVDPDAVAAEGEGGARRAYVAMTRTTDVLHVLRRRGVAREGGKA